MIEALFFEKIRFIVLCFSSALGEVELDPSWDCIQPNQCMFNDCLRIGMIKAKAIVYDQKLDNKIEQKKRTRYVQ